MKKAAKKAEKPEKGKAIGMKKTEKKPEKGKAVKEEKRGAEKKPEEGKAVKEEKKGRTARAFEISGTFREGKREKKFVKIIGAFNENFAKEKLMAVIGSKHGTKRRHIRIASCREVEEGAESVGKM